MRVRMDDGSEGDARAGDVVHIGPGHDAWTVGDEACVMVDFGASVGSYAKHFEAALPDHCPGSSAVRHLLEWEDGRALT